MELSDLDLAGMTISRVAMSQERKDQLFYEPHPEVMYEYTLDHHSGFAMKFFLEAERLQEPEAEIEAISHEIKRFRRALRYADDKNLPPTESLVGEGMRLLTVFQENQKHKVVA